jgi:hypothetical protein
LLGDTEPLHQLRGDDAARAGRMGNRLGCEHRVLEGLGCADVGLRRSRLDRDADAGSGEINAAVYHLALLDEIVDHVVV